MLAAKKNMTLRPRGFTLVELMIISVIIAILVGLAVPSYITARLKAEEQKGAATLHAFAKAQMAFFFDQPEPPQYANMIDSLTPSYVDVPINDGDWEYDTNGGANTFTVTAHHLNAWGARDGLTLQLVKGGEITRIGAWPY